MAMTGASGPDHERDQVTEPEWWLYLWRTNHSSQAHLTRLDAAGVADYLEATSEGARDLYTTHGYQTREPFHMPNKAPMWPTWRAPARLRQQKGAS